MTASVEPHPSIWWQALYSRDQRFDGRFFIGAATTRIYCRPICPVPFAKPNNLVWFACAAAAEAAGFRPCRRCRAETSPGTPAWVGTSAIVSRALRLISQGALDEDGVEDLARRVGIGSRQLRRLFAEHLGASPIRIAITHRVHFARNLLEETNLPITHIALSAGFTSIRQFNHAVQAICGQSPTDLRRARQEFPKPPQTGLVLRLPYRPPLDWPALVAFLRARATPAVEVVEDHAYRRTVSIDGVAGVHSPGVIEVRPDPTQPLLTVRIDLPAYQSLMKIVERVRRIFDLGADPLRIAEDLSRDPRLKPLLERDPGLRVPGVWDGFELAVEAILGEQLTVGASKASVGRLVRSFGRPFPSSVPGLTHLFPTPADLLHADLSKAGIRGDRAATLHALVRAVSSGELTFSGSLTLPEAISRLCAVPGIAECTAHYIAMRALGEPDAWPFADPAAGNWRPWRAYAALHLVFNPRS